MVPNVQPRTIQYILLFYNYICTPFSEVAVGLEQVTYTVMETQGIVEVCARIMEGQLQRSVVVTLSTAIEGMSLYT